MCFIYLLSFLISHTDPFSLSNTIPLLLSGFASRLTVLHASTRRFTIILTRGDMVPHGPQTAWYFPTNQSIIILIFSSDSSRITKSSVCERSANLHFLPSYENLTLTLSNPIFTTSFCTLWKAKRTWYFLALNHCHLQKTHSHLPLTLQLLHTCFS